MRKVICLAAAVLLLTAITIPAMANEDAQLPYVTDLAGLLTDTQQQSLEALAQDISREYQCGVYIIAVEDFTDYSHASGIRQAAEDIYLQYDLGYGSRDDGVLLMLSMDERDYALIVYGDNALLAFTDYGQEQLEKTFLDDFRYDDWYDGFEDYLNKSAYLLSLAESGTPLDVEKEGGSYFVELLVIILGSCLISGLICGVLVSQMKTAVKGTHATEYITEKGIDIRVRTDRYTHTTQVRRKIQTNNSSGGRATTNSRGFSGRSGKF